MKKYAIYAGLVCLSLVPIPGTAVLAILLYRRLGDSNRVVVCGRPELKVHDGGKE